MRIALLCLGSEGDVRIFVTFAATLKADGHDVVIASNPSTEKLCVENGLRFLPLAGDLTTSLNIDKASIGFGKLQIIKILARILNEAINEQFAFLEKELRKVDAVFYHPAVFAAPHLIEALNLPGMCLLFLPEVPTRHHSSCLFPANMPFKKWSNLTSHYLMAQLFWTPVRKTINRNRALLGLKKLGHFAPLSYQPFQQIPKLITVSPTMIPRPPDWPNNVYVTGYLHAPKAEGYIPPTFLQRFLDEGTSPIFVGFGSLAERCDEKMVFAIFETLCKLKIRAILGGSFLGLKKEVLPNHILWIERAPYDWLFPRVRAVVHHGGTGTTHCCLKEGKPALIVPFLLDQFYWGDRIWRLGVGPKPLPAKKLTQKTFTLSLQALMDRPSYYERAANLSHQMQTEEGVKNALQIFYKQIKNSILD